jgi:anti-sigma B factor antagonist
MPAAFAIDEHPVDSDRHVVAVRGELDLYTASELKEVFAGAIDAGRIRIIVDLADTTFLDTSALSVLLSAFKRLRSRGGALVLAGLNEKIAKVFEITGLDKTFTILPSREAAVEAIATADAA